MSSVDELIQHATILVRNGNKVEAKKILTQVVKQEPKNARIWYLLSQVAENQEQSLYCLNKVLEIDPHNKPARMWLKSIESEKMEIPRPQHPEPSQTNVAKLLPVVLLIIVVVVIIGILIWVMMGGLGSL